MKNILRVLFILLIIVSCSTQSKKETDDQTVENSDMNNVDSAETKETTSTKTMDLRKIDYTLDSLLSIDSERELIEIFGQENIERKTIYGPEGMGEFKVTILFPKSKNTVEIHWNDEINFNKLSRVRVFKQRSDWKTKEGIRVGTSIEELEIFNKKPFTFYGLEWDFSGGIDWNEGYLDKRKIYGSLGYPDKNMPEEFNSLIGDHTIQSSSEIARKAILILSELVLIKKDN